MKTTIDIHDELLVRAKLHAKKTGRTLRSVIEDGLRKTLSDKQPRKRYGMSRNLTTGNPGDPNPFENLSWEDVREMIYEDWRRV